jgi:type IV secretory pathway VirB4 component
MDPRKDKKKGNGPPVEAGTPGKDNVRPVRNPNSTQNTLLLSEIREGMVVMSDGSFRAVVACESINFDLMSPAEREGVEYSYQSFLNSLYFPVQIQIRSQRVDIGPYLEKLGTLRRDQDNILLGVLMDDYMDFIEQLANEANIMDKTFYIIVPYYPGGDVNMALNLSRNMVTGAFKPQKQTLIKIDKAAYDKAKDEIRNRVNLVMSGVTHMGVRGTQLDTKQLANLYYNFYNPDTAVRQPLVDFDSIVGTYVEKAPGPAKEQGSA